MADQDSTTGRSEGHVPPIKAECETMRLALVRAADVLSAVSEALRQTEADIDRAAEWLAALLAVDMKGAPR